MDMTRHHSEIVQQNLPNNTSVSQVNAPRHMSMREKIFHTNWGLVLIGALVGIGILVATLNVGQVETTAKRSADNANQVDAVEVLPAD